jgi:cytochrome d ubiquinol oxidase subunit I
VSDLLAARFQMAFSLGFHILFAVAGIALPALMVLAEGRWLRSGHPVDLDLAKRWSKGAAVLFAVGAISGTVLSFELGLLWPRFMAFAGPIIGMPFSLEGVAFFLEAICLGLYLYGWDKLSPRAHWLSGAGVLASGTLSGAFVVTANAWMNTPAGFTLVDGKPVDIRPLAAFWNPAAPTEIAHMTLAAFLSIGFLAAAIHAYQLLKRPSEFHRRAFTLALSVGGAAALLQPFSGDSSARQVALNQPAKLAALEGQWETERGAPLRIGGLPDDSEEVTRYALEIPHGLSLLARHDWNAEIVGLKAFPAEDRPPSIVVHLAFQVMVGCGTILFLAAALAAFLAWRRRESLFEPWFLKLVALTGPLGVVALEAGWTVTEVGRQPWIIAHVVRVRDAVTPMPGLRYSLAAVVFVYALLSAVVFATLRSQVREAVDAP